MTDPVVQSAQKWFRVLFFLLCALVLNLLPAKGSEYEVAEISDLPEKLAQEWKQALNPNGISINGSNSTRCRLWQMEKIPTIEDFEPTLTIFYPLNVGQPLGIMEVPDDAEFTDFRGQEIEAGLYSLRYGQQPEDGNHLGTSETYDFVLMLPLDIDKSPKTKFDAEGLSEESAEAGEGSHPAILLLMPVEEDDSYEEPQMVLDDDTDFELLEANLNYNSSTPLPIRLVLEGEADE